MDARALFVAGASGAVGRTVVRLADARDRLLPHYRRPPDGGAPPGAHVFALADRAKLVEALRGASAVAQLIGTIRKRFASGDTYETSDIGTTQLLVDAAREAGTIDHVILLSSVGAGRPIGAYLRAKARAEAIVTEAGFPYTILRPSAFDGEGHRAPPGAGLLARLPGLRSFRPIEVEALARAILHVARTRGPLGAVLEGDPLFDVVAQAAR